MMVSFWLSSCINKMVNQQLICSETFQRSLSEHENVAISQGHDQAVPNGAKNGRLHTVSGHNADTNLSVIRACAHLTQLLIVLCKSKTKKTKTKCSLLQYEL